MFIRMELDPGETPDLFHLNTGGVKDIIGGSWRNGTCCWSGGEVQETDTRKTFTTIMKKRSKKIKECLGIKSVRRHVRVKTQQLDCIHHYA